MKSCKDSVYSDGKHCLKDCSPTRALLQGLKHPCLDERRHGPWAQTCRRAARSPSVPGCYRAYSDSICEGSPFQQHRNRQPMTTAMTTLEILLFGLPGLLCSAPAVTADCCIGVTRRLAWGTRSIERRARYTNCALWRCPRTR